MPSSERARTPSAHAIIILIPRPTFLSTLALQCHPLVSGDHLIRPPSSRGADALRRRNVGDIRRGHKTSRLGHRRRGADDRLRDLVCRGAVDLARLAVQHSISRDRTRDEARCNTYAATLADVEISALYVVMVWTISVVYGTSSVLYVVVLTGTLFEVV